MSSEWMTLSEAAKELRIGGFNVSTHTLWRWCRKGIRGHHLRHTKAGRRILVRKSDWHDFLERLAEEDTQLAKDTQTTPQIRYRRRVKSEDIEQRRRATQQRLAERGIK